MGITKIDIDIESKIKISGIQYLEIRVICYVDMFLFQGNPLLLNNGNVYQTILNEEYTDVEPIFNEIDNNFSKTLKDCRDKYFHSIKYKYVSDINFTKLRIKIS